MSRPLHFASGSPGTRQRLLAAGAIVLMVVAQSPIATWVAPGNSFPALVRGELIFWALTALIVCYVLFVERRPLSSMGLRTPTWKTLVFGVVAALIMIGGAVLLYAYVFPALRLGPNAAGLATIQKLPLWFQITILVRAPVFEEIFYRGFVIERLGSILRNQWIAAAISLVAFTYAHLSYWGWAALIVVGFQGLVLTALFLWRGDLGANMIAHFITDAVAFFAF